MTPDLRAAAQRVEQISTELLRLYDWRFELAKEEAEIGDLPDGWEFENAATKKRWLAIRKNLVQYGREKAAAWAELRPALAALRSALAAPMEELPRPVWYAVAEARERLHVGDIVYVTGCHRGSCCQPNGVVAAVYYPRPDCEQVINDWRAFDGRTLAHPPTHFLWFDFAPDSAPQSEEGR